MNRRVNKKNSCHLPHCRRRYMTNSVCLNCRSIGPHECTRAGTHQVVPLRPNSPPQRDSRQSVVVHQRNTRRLSTPVFIYSRSDDLSARGMADRELSQVLNNSLYKAQRRLNVNPSARNLLPCCQMRGDINTQYEMDEIILMNKSNNQGPTSPYFFGYSSGSAITCNKIFVGGLSWDTTQSSLYEYFSLYGEIVDCILMVDNTTGRSRGFGFVTYADSLSVKIVLRVSQHKLDGKVVDPKLAIPKYLKDLENKVINNESREEPCETKFSPINIYATPLEEEVDDDDDSASIVLSSQVLKNRKLLDSVRAINKAFTTFNCEAVKVVTPIQKTVPIEEQTKVFVGGIGHATELDLKEYFSAFGDIVEVNIMIDKATGRPRGFAFVSFSNTESAMCAANVRYHTVRKRRIEVKMAVPKETLAAVAANARENDGDSIRPRNGSSNEDGGVVDNQSPLPSTDYYSAKDENELTPFCDTLNPTVHPVTEQHNKVLQTGVTEDWDFNEALLRVAKNATPDATSSVQPTQQTEQPVAPPTPRPCYPENNKSSALSSIHSPSFIHTAEFTGIGTSVSDPNIFSKSSCGATQDSKSVHQAEDASLPVPPELTKSASLRSVCPSKTTTKDVPQGTKDSIKDLLDQIWQ